jgi:uncharacterized protein (DUF111 family)
MSKARDLASGQNGVRPFATAAGIASIPAPASANTLTTASVTFPSGRFTETPVVTGVIGNAATNQRTFKIDGLSTSGFTAGQWQTTGATMQSTSFYWRATQMTSTSGAG